MHPTPRQAAGLSLAFALCCLFSQSSFAQYKSTDGNAGTTSYDVVSLGIGVGLDYGGLGLQFGISPQRNFVLFGAGGYALAGFGYNAGLKLRLNPDLPVDPFLVGMYGYNAAIVVNNTSPVDVSSYNKLFYGPSVGAGVDVGRKGIKKGYWTFALLAPIRSPDVNNYIDYLQAQGAQFKSKPLPVLLSFGYKLKLQ